MVPVSDDGPTVATIRAGLEAASRVGGEEPLSLAFHAWALGAHDPLAGLAAGAAQGFDIPTDRSFRHVATLGYASAAHRLPESLRPVLADAIRWLAERSWHRPLREPTLEVDGVSMLGVSLGAGASDEGATARLGALAVASAGLPTLSGLNRSLMTAAAHVLRAPGRPDLSAMLPEARVALADLGLVPDDEGCGPPAWRSALRFVPGEGGAARAAITLRAFDAMCERNMPARLGRLEAEDVLRVLRGVRDRSFREWVWEDRARTPNSLAAKWRIENEYHVQDMLWAILAPLFPDLHKEEYAAPVGHKNPRMDLSIPSLRLVVEVKFMRQNKSFADVQEEVGADNTLYQADPRWEVLIPFVWDDSRRIEQHETLRDGLRRMPMVYDAVVMPRPGRMDRYGEDAAAARGRRKGVRAVPSGAPLTGPASPAPTGAPSTASRSPKPSKPRR